MANSNDLNDNDFDNDRVSPPADCNDRDATVSSNQQYYIDNDADGVGTGVTNNICAAAPPAHYTANQQVDCNDNDPTVSANQTYYLDADGDGLGTIKETTQVCASVPPAGYVANSNDQLDAIDLDNDGVPAGQDCNDNDNTVSRIYYFYPDPDGDGKGYGRIPEQFCSSTPPAHYANNNNDVSENDFDND